MPDLHSDAREDSFSPIINSADGEIIDAKSLIQHHNNPLLMLLPVQIAIVYVRRTYTVPVTNQTRSLTYRLVRYSK